jgi:hypothetical protein
VNQAEVRANVVRKAPQWPQGPPNYLESPSKTSDSERRELNRHELSLVPTSHALVESASPPRRGSIHQTLRDVVWQIILRWTADSIYGQRLAISEKVHEFLTFISTGFKNVSVLSKFLRLFTAENGA